jgi:hypothetical protein
MEYNWVETNVPARRIPAMIYRGHVKSGQIVLDEPVELEEGMAVQVELLTEQKGKTLTERFKNIVGKAEGLPDDLAENHDHYVYGTPKK